LGPSARAAQRAGPHSRPGVPDGELARVVIVRSPEPSSQDGQRSSREPASVRTAPTKDSRANSAIKQALASSRSSSQPLFVSMISQL
ncbi:MAG: hypothetical protein AAGB04_13205, partial [Pseudomonadota bacterium]